MSYFGGIRLLYVPISYFSLMNEPHVPIFDVVCECVCVARERSCGGFIARN